MKKLLALFASVASVPVFAADGDNALTQITTKVGTELTSWNEAITSFFISNFSTIATILGVAIGVTVLWIAFKLFNKGAKKVG